MKDNAVTIADVISWSPCGGYTLKRLEELAAGRKRMTASEILSLDIPMDHRLWVVLRPTLVRLETIRIFAVDCAALAEMDGKS